MKVMIGALKRPFRRVNRGFVTLRIAPAAPKVSDNLDGSLTWVATLRWVKGVTWLLVMLTVVWDLAVTFGPHFGLAW
jgi:hypothetical protein